MFPGHIQVVVGGDALAPGIVVAGTRFIDFGDGNEPHVKPFPGLFVLALDGRFSCFGGCDGVFGAQDIEVGGCYIKNQLLLGQVVLGLGRLGLELAGFVAEPVLSPEQWLSQFDSVAVGAITVSREELPRQFIGVCPPGYIPGLETCVAC